MISDEQRLAAAWGVVKRYGKGIAFVSEVDDALRALIAQGRRAALPVAALSDADRELMQEALKALESAKQMSERGAEPRKLEAALTWRQNDEIATSRVEAAIAALRTRLLRHSEGKE